MVEKIPIISNVHFENKPERLKAVMPLKRKWPFLVIYSVLVILWLVLLIGGVIFTVRLIFSGERYVFWFSVMALVFLYVLFRFGRFLLGQWAHYLATREILFINLEELILRRPISIWGNTDVYDMQHINGVKLSDDPPAVTFDYGYRHVYFGEALTSSARQELARFLNDNYFPERADENENDLDVF